VFPSAPHTLDFSLAGHLQGPPLPNSVRESKGVVFTPGSAAGVGALLQGQEP